MTVTVIPLRTWAKTLIATKPFRLVAVALANKLARLLFALMRSGETYRHEPAAAAA